MPKYLIEREWPAYAELSPEAVEEMGQRSLEILNAMGPQIRWVHSYITGDKVYCIYFAANEELIREHGRRGGFPVTAIAEITSAPGVVFAEA